MSFGDDLMASGHARVESQRCGGPVHILDRNGRPRWSPLWEGLDWIARPGQQAAGQVINGSGCRPYLKYPFTREGGAHFSGWRARDHIGALALRNEERQWARAATAGLGEFVLLEPELAPEANPNKQWGRDKWMALSERFTGHPTAHGTPGSRTRPTAGRDLRRDLRLVQPLASPSTAALDGVVGIPCPSFRHAAALIEVAAISILPEGGLHHAAGALGRPAVVLFGGCIPPEITGYPMHTNLADTGPGSPCGSWMPCEHCRQVWARLRPATVYAAAQHALEERPANGPEL